MRPCNNMTGICCIEMQESITLPEVNITPIIIALLQRTKQRIFLYLFIYLFFWLRSVQMGKYSQNNFISFCIYLPRLGLTLTRLTLKSAAFAYLLFEAALASRRV